MDFPLSSTAIISTQVEQELNAPSIVMPVNFRKNPKNFFGLRILIRIMLFQTIPSFLQIDINLLTVIPHLFLILCHLKNILSGSRFVINPYNFLHFTGSNVVLFYWKLNHCPISVQFLH